MIQVVDPKEFTTDESIPHNQLKTRVTIKQGSKSDPSITFKHGLAITGALLTTGIARNDDEMELFEMTLLPMANPKMRVTSNAEHTALKNLIPPQVGHNRTIVKDRYYQNMARWKNQRGVFFGKDEPDLAKV